MNILNGLYTLQKALFLFIITQHPIHNNTKVFNFTVPMTKVGSEAKR